MEAAYHAYLAMFKYHIFVSMELGATSKEALDDIQHDITLALKAIENAPKV